MSADASVRAQRTRSQRLHAGAAHDRADVATVVREVAAIQAQDGRAALLGVRVRSGALVAGDVSTARALDRSIVRAWCMRGTLHLVPAGQLRELLAVFGPVFIHRSKRRLAQLGLDEDVCRRALPRVREVLGASGPLTRHEIAEALTNEGVAIDRDGQAPVHLVRRACLEGIAVETVARDGEPAYQLLDDWLPGDPCDDRAAALANLARRYLSAHQPAGVDDFATWSGLPAADVRAAWRALAGDLIATDADRQLWRLPEESPHAEAGGATSVRLLPAFDNYLLGYRERSHAVDPARWPAVHPGGGIIRPTVMLDGSCVATWRIDRSHRLGRVVVRPLGALPARATEGLRAEVDDVGRFLGAPLDLDFDHG